MTTEKKAELRIPAIDFDMPISDLILELEKLRNAHLELSTPPDVFFQMKAIFHMMESIGSSRIEGNNTTVLNYVEASKIAPPDAVSRSNEDLIEIKNIESAMKYIEKNIAELNIDKKFFRELHSLTVCGLSPSGEGAKIVGGFRESPVRISGSQHQPPEHYEVDFYIDELFAFINEAKAPKYDLIRIALVHHRLAWIHPFENGNGRVIRLFTYALLIKLIFKNSRRIINPTAVFCSDRNRYYHYLSLADEGSDEGYIAWVSYMLEGLKTEIEKIEKLSDYEYLKTQILYPALKHAESNMHITRDEMRVLTLAVNKGVIKANHVKELLQSENNSRVSRLIRALLDKKMLEPISEKGRMYSIVFINNMLMISILSQLDALGFLPVRAR